VVVIHPQNPVTGYPRADGTGMTLALRHFLIYLQGDAVLPLEAIVFVAGLVVIIVNSTLGQRPNWVETPPFGGACDATRLTLILIAISTVMNE
jgi:hypothetical protein